MTSDRPTYDIDLYSDEVIGDPYPHYRALRDAGAAVWLTKNEAWAITRYQDVRDALRNPQVFSSAHGCMLNEPMNEAVKGIMLCSDDPHHMALRKVFAEPLMPGALAKIKDRLVTLADAKIDELVDSGSFDAVADLAHYLPLTVVTELVGLNDEGRAQMLAWAAGIFNAFGPLPNARTEAGLATAQLVFEYINTRAPRETFLPGGLGARIFECADRGLVSQEQAKVLLIDYLTPALDTTINATSSAIWLFGQFPDQWDLIREDPSLIPNAINEVVRLESPIRAFARYVTQDHTMGGVALDAGSRAVILYASANRDERKWDDPERFDVRRKVADHMGFGHGTHTCAGMHLAKMEIQCLLEALARRVHRFELGEGQHSVHNVLRGLVKLPVAVH